MPRKDDKEPRYLNIEVPYRPKVQKEEEEPPLEWWWKVYIYLSIGIMYVFIAAVGLLSVWAIAYGIYLHFKKLILF